MINIFKGKQTAYN